jgi:RNA polymerase sigma factor for flagellar operon FliA
MPNPSELFLEQLPLIERIIRSVCYGRRMTSAETEEFAGFARLRLIENDYAIIRKFKGRSRFGTFMTTVIGRLLNDYTDRERGRWRNSEEAKRRGDLAKDLEQLLVRDKRTLDEAFRELQPKYPDITRRQLEELATRFPIRFRRKFVALEESGERTAFDGRDDIGHEEMTSLISSVISEFIERLPKEDQLIFQLRFESDMPVPQIAKMLKQGMQAIYRRLYKHYDDLRVALEARGVRAADVAALTRKDGARLDFRIKTVEPDPSNDDGDPDGAPKEDA